MTISKTIDEYEKHKKSPRIIGTCEFCKKPINECEESTWLQNPHRNPPAIMHTNCYYEGLGDLIEKHPICSPISGHGVVVDDEVADSDISGEKSS